MKGLRFIFEFVVVISILMFPAMVVCLGAIGVGYMINVKELHFVLQGLFSFGVAICFFISSVLGVLLLDKFLK